MPKVDLYYFPLKGLGESARLLLAHSGVDFEDHRLKDDWPEFKPKTPFGQLPMLVIDGKKYSQSLAIARYLGHRYGLAGDGLEDAFEIDQNLDFFYDIRLRLAGMSTVLHYFDVKGLGEALRLLLAYGGEQFTDHRVTFTEWPTFKASTPMQQMPVLEMGGRVYTQSSAIAKYLGRKYGLTGNDPEEDFKIDESLEFLGDIRYRASMVHYEPDAAVKARKHDTFSKDFYPRALKELERIISENDGYFALGRLTWVDFVFAGMFDYLKVMLQAPDLETQYPSFRKVVDHVYSIPQVKTWCEGAQKSEYNF